MSPGLRWTTLALMVVAPVLTFAVAYLSSVGSALPYVVMAAAQVTVGLLLLGWARSMWKFRRKASAWDFGAVLVAAVSGAAATWLILMFATAQGIRGSAWPRIRAGYSMRNDYEYLAALAAVLVMFACVLVLVATMVRSAIKPGSVRRVGQAARAKAAQAMVEKRVEVQYATSEQDSIMARMLSPLTRILFGLCAALSLAGLITVSASDGNVAVIGGWVLFVAPAVPTVWAVVESLWRRDAQMGPILGSLWRTMVVPFVTVLPIAAVLLLVTLLPPVREGLTPDTWAAATWEGPLPEPDMYGFAWLGACLSLACAMALMGGLAFTVAIALPWFAFFRPSIFMADNMLDTSPQAYQSNVTAVRALTVIIILAFLIPTLMVMAEQWSLWWWVGVGLIPVGLFALYLTYTRQRVDHAKRSKHGVQGFSSPHDPAP
ncbi:MAG: hypothetical protein Q4G32_08730 [Kocuria sp.]|nr:hypothetical protein [Kocuria sp.]